MTLLLSATRYIFRTAHPGHKESPPPTDASNNLHRSHHGFLVATFLALLFTGVASAQDIPDNLTNGRMIAIEPIGPTQSTVVVGQKLTGVGVATQVSAQAGNSYALWKVEPASAARVLQPNPVRSANNTVDIEFLQATTVTVTVSAFEDETDPLFMDNLLFDGLEFNQVEYTFIVVDANSGQNPQAASPLNSNQRTAQSTFEKACDAVSAGNQGSNTVGQNDLQSTCNIFELQGQLPDNLDRLVADELFALGDSLTITSDQHISNIQSRLNIVRAGTRAAFDISSLNVQLWDQHISANVLNASKDALLEFAGGSASSDTIRESALGVFANGNISMGKVDGKGLQRDAELASNSLTLGADYRIDEQRVIGAALGIVNDEADFKGDNGDMNMQGISLTAFGTWYEQDKGYADVIVELGQHDFNLKRRINLIGQPNEFANSSTDGLRMVLSISAGRTFQRGTTEFGPVIRMAATRASIDGFKEASSRASGGAGTALDVKSHALTSIRLSVGGEVKRVINLSQSVLLPTLRVELEMENETDKGAIAATFINDPDDNKMQFIGTQRSNRALVVNAGLTAVLKHGRSAFVSFETRAMDDHVSQNRLRLGYRMNF